MSDEILEKFLRWMIGFGFASAAYLVSALWLIRRFRSRRAQGPASSPAAPRPSDRTGADSDDKPGVAARGGRRFTAAK